MNIGKALREFRKRKYPELTQAQYAERIGFTQNYISMVESGHRRGSSELLDAIQKDANIPLILLFWFALDESEIKRGKQKHFRFLKPTIDAMFDSLI